MQINYKALQAFAYSLPIYSLRVRQCLKNKRASALGSHGCLWTGRSLSD